MDEESTRKTLLALLERGGAEYVETNGFVRFRTRRDGMLWETLCRCGNGEALIYGRYPFCAEDRAETL